MGRLDVERIPRIYGIVNERRFPWPWKRPSRGKGKQKSAPSSREKGKRGSRIDLYA
ncbi:MAG: hypothetical protein GXO38_04040 [Epsilonproteobacteria bacterium]|nr:hypothetical protein [Campylobacterota bacterium]